MVACSVGTLHVHLRLLLREEKRIEDDGERWRRRHRRFKRKWTIIGTRKYFDTCLMLIISPNMAHRGRGRSLYEIGR